MNYEQMTQLALLIREDGLPGAHHFYITFMTRYPGVEIDDGLAAKYPDEITIVLEHQYWDLKPYHAITRFHDPSVGFALQFDPPPEMDGSEPIAQIARTIKKKTAAKKSSAWIASGRSKS